VMEWDEFTEPGFDFSRGFTPTVRLKEDRPHYPDMGGHVLAARVTGDKLNVVYVADIDMISDWFFFERSRGESNLNFDNVTFVLNAVDVLAGDNTFLNLRKRRTELRTLTAVEARTAQFVQERILKTKEADDEAKAQLQQAQHRFDEKTVEIQKDPKLSPPEKEELIRRLKEGEERRLEVSKVEIDRKKQQQIDEVKNETERRIRETERKVMLLAVLVPPFPAIVLGGLVYFLRLAGEKRHISPDRMAKK
jgi:ABC-2 type transport system permease protein